MIRSVLRNSAIAGACLFVSAGAAAAQSLSAQQAATPPPAEVAEPIKALLGPEATVVTRGANTIELWWQKALALESAPGSEPAWSNVADGTVVGVMRTSKPLNDIRGLPMKPGVYVLRFALQPQDGDHMGVSPNREFLLVSPAAEDQSAEAVGYKQAVALSRKTQGKSHPAPLSIDPATTDHAPGSVITTETGLKSVVVSVPVTSKGAPAGKLTFGLVLVGQIEH